MKSMYRTCLLIVFFAGTRLAGMAQDINTISGVVTTYKNYPLNNVKLIASRSGEVTTSDSSGVFALKCNKRDVVTVSASGFRRKKIRVAKKDVYHVDLTFTDNVSNFNAAVTNGHITEEALRQAIMENMDKSEKDFSRYSTIYVLVQNEIPGVRVEGNNVYNRKITSFTTSPEVLYVIDGVVSSDISRITPYMVKSIEFIDDAGTSMYGLEGGNGVLKIETRKQ